MTKVFSLQKSFSSVLHELSRAALPLIVFALTLGDLKVAALLMVLLFKWRVLAVKSRFWMANIRANMVDILIGLSVVEFMSETDFVYQLIWLVFYLVWVLYIKKLSSQPGMIAQGVIAFCLALSALLGRSETISFSLLLAGSWLVAYFSSRHIVSAFKETHAPMLAHIWALFVVQLTWVLWHWQVWYWFIAQIVLITTIGLLGFSITYALSKKENPNGAMIRQILLSTSIMMLIVVLIHNWRETNF